MTHLIIHVGTGTIIDADECVIVNVEQLDDHDTALVTDGDDSDVVEIAERLGKPVNTTDLRWGNTVAFSPVALREEAEAILDAGIYEEGEVWYDAMKWCTETATDDQLNEVASYVLDDDDLWTTYRTSVTEGLLQGLRWQREKKESE